MPRGGRVHNVGFYRPLELSPPAPWTHHTCLYFTTQSSEGCPFSWGVLTYAPRSPITHMVRTRVYRRVPVSSVGFRRPSELYPSAPWKHQTFLFLCRTVSNVGSHFHGGLVRTLPGSLGYGGTKNTCLTHPGYPSSSFTVILIPNFALQFRERTTPSFCFTSQSPGGGFCFHRDLARMYPTSPRNRRD